MEINNPSQFPITCNGENWTKKIYLAILWLGEKRVSLREVKFTGGLQSLIHKSCFFNACILFLQMIACPILNSLNLWNFTEQNYTNA